MPLVRPRMHRDSARTCRDAGLRGGHDIGLGAAARIAQHGDLVDVDAENGHAIRIRCACGRGYFVAASDANHVSRTPAAIGSSEAHDDTFGLATLASLETNLARIVRIRETVFCKRSERDRRAAGQLQRQSAAFDGYARERSRIDTVVAGVVRKQLAAHRHHLARQSWRLRRQTLREQVHAAVIDEHARDLRQFALKRQRQRITARDEHVVVHLAQPHGGRALQLRRHRTARRAHDQLRTAGREAIKSGVRLGIT